MEQKDLDSWQELETELATLSQIRADIAQAGGLSASPLLFRGQRNADWDLHTTLERRVDGNLRLAQYFRLAWVIKPQLETFTGRQWDMPEFPELRKWAGTYDSLKITQFPGYDYFVYLRHHGFPSPLLDWTKSPYVAAYFGATNVRSDRFAIYAYMEYAGQGKVGGSDTAQIVGFGPYVRSHPRHFLQHSQYTAACFFEQDSGWRFAPHEEVFAEGATTQDRLWKFTLPSSAAPAILQHLDKYNLNASALFQTEEALLETMALREIEFRDRDL